MERDDPEMWAIAAMSYACQTLINADQPDALARALRYVRQRFELDAVAIPELCKMNSRLNEENEELKRSIAELDDRELPTAEDVT
jgi:hypothetical protein